MRMVRAKKLSEESLVLEADLVMSPYEWYPFKLNMGLGSCEVSRRDYLAVPENIWKETMKNLLPYKEVVFEIKEDD